MSIASIGVGVYGLSKGILNGLQISREFSGMRDDDEIRDMRKKGMEEARAESNGYADANVKEVGGTGGTAFAQGQTPDADPKDAISLGLANMEKRNAAGDTLGLSLKGDMAYAPQEKAGFKYGEASYSTRDEAKAAAQKDAPDVMDIFRKKMGPTIAAKYIEQGRDDMAEKWTDYLDSAHGKKATRGMLDVMKAVDIGDHKSALDKMVKAYPDYMDGYSVVGKPSVGQDANGGTVYQLKMKNDANGETFDKVLNPQDVISMGYNVASKPESIFEKYVEHQRSIEKETVKARAEALKDAQKYKRDVALKGYENGLSIRRDNNQSGNRMREDAANYKPSSIQAEIEAKRGLGMPDTEIVASLRSGGGSNEGSTLNKGRTMKELWSQFARQDPKLPSGKYWSDSNDDDKEKYARSVMKRFAEADGTKPSQATQPSATPYIYRP